MNDDDPFSKFAPPELPPDLRAPVLAAARAAFVRAGETDPQPDPWSRLVKSRTARLAWAATVLLLLGLHAALPGRPAGRTPLAAAAPRPDAEVTAIATLPRIEERVVTARSGETS
jgi:hypothetical protein